VTEPLRLWRPWEPGQHVSLIGLTGSGKSTLASRMLDGRRFVVVLRTKADRVKYARTHHADVASAMEDPRHDRIELRPRFQHQQREIATALDKVYRHGGWTCYVDELWYVDQELGCRPLLNRLLTQGRDPGVISVVCAMQRPVQVTRFALGESTHVFSFGLDGRDAKEVGDATAPRFGKMLTTLDGERHEFGHWHVPSRRMWRGRLDVKTGQLIGQEVT
jgi:hypothetical protein